MLFFVCQLLRFTYFLSMYAGGDRAHDGRTFFRCRSAAVKMIATLILHDFVASRHFMQLYQTQQQHVPIEQTVQLIWSVYHVEECLRELLRHIDDLAPCAAIHPLGTDLDLIGCECVARDHANQHMNPRKLFISDAAALATATAVGSGVVGAGTDVSTTSSTNKPNLLSEMWVKYQSWLGKGFPAVWRGEYEPLPSLKSEGFKLPAMADMLRRRLARLLVVCRRSDPNPNPNPNPMTPVPLVD